MFCRGDRAEPCNFCKNPTLMFIPEAVVRVTGGNLALSKSRLAVCATCIHIVEKEVKAHQGACENPDCPCVEARKAF